MYNLCLYIPGKECISKGANRNGAGGGGGGVKFTEDLNVKGGADCELRIFWRKIQIFPECKNKLLTDEKYILKPIKSKESRSWRREGGRSWLFMAYLLYLPNLMAIIIQQTTLLKWGFLGSKWSRKRNLY